MPSSNTLIRRLLTIGNGEACANAVQERIAWLSGSIAAHGETSSMADSEKITSPPATTDSTREKSCRLCAQQIPRAAKVCHVCSGHQGNTLGRILNIGTPVLALLIALIAVTTQGGDFAWRSYTALFGNEQIHCRLLTHDGDSGTIRLFVTNTGTRDGAIGDVRLMLPAEAAPKAEAYIEPMEIVEGDRLIRAGESTELVLRGTPSSVPNAPGRVGRTASFALVIKAMRFRHGTRDVIVRFDGAL